MQISSLPQKFGRDLIYLLVIGGMTGWIWMDGKRDETWNKVCLTDLKDATSMANFTVNMSEKTVQRHHFDYPSPFSEDIFKRTQKLRFAVDTVFTHKINQLEAAISTEAGIDNRVLTLEELKDLEEASRVLASSMSSLVDDESSINPIIWNCLFGDHIWEKAQSATPAQTKALLQSLRYKAKKLSREALGYFYQRIQAPECGGFPMIVPHVQAEKSTLKIGETYDATIYIADLIKITPSTTIRMDGIELPSGTFSSSFSEYCSRPGEKKHQIEIEFKDPATGEIYFIRRGDFSYTVVDSCR